VGNTSWSRGGSRGCIPLQRGAFPFRPQMCSAGHLVASLHKCFEHLKVLKADDDSRHEPVPAAARVPQNASRSIPQHLAQRNPSFLKQSSRDAPQKIPHPCKMSGRTCQHNGGMGGLGRHSRQEETRLKRRSASQTDTTDFFQDVRGAPEPGTDIRPSGIWLIWS